MLFAASTSLKLIPCQQPCFSDQALLNFAICNMRYKDSLWQWLTPSQLLRGHLLMVARSVLQMLLSAW